MMSENRDSESNDDDDTSSENGRAERDTDDRAVDSGTDTAENRSGDESTELGP